MSAPIALPPPALYVQKLTLERGGRTLARELDLFLPNKTILQLRGPNGAGKTSLLLTLAGLLRPAAGSVEFRDKGRTEPLAPRLHLLPVLSAIKAKLTVHENLRFWRALNGPTGIAIEAALKRVRLAGLDDIEAGHLSTGQQRRLAIARLLVSERLIWLLDEPAASLDAEGERLVNELIAEHCADAGIVVVATHHDLTVEPTETVTLGGAA